MRYRNTNGIYIDLAKVIYAKNAINIVDTLL